MRANPIIKMLHRIFIGWMALGFCSLALANSKNQSVSIVCSDLLKVHKRSQEIQEIQDILDREIMLYKIYHSRPNSAEGKEALQGLLDGVEIYLKKISQKQAQLSFDNVENFKDFLAEAHLYTIQVIKDKKWDPQAGLNLYAYLNNTGALKRNIRGAGSFLEHPIDQSSAMLAHTIRQIKSITHFYHHFFSDHKAKLNAHELAYILTAFKRAVKEFNDIVPVKQVEDNISPIEIERIIRTIRAKYNRPLSLKSWHESDVGESKYYQTKVRKFEVVLATFMKKIDSGTLLEGVERDLLYSLISSDGQSLNKLEMATELKDEATLLAIKAPMKNGQAPSTSELQARRSLLNYFFNEAVKSHGIWPTFIKKPAHLMNYDPKVTSAPEFNYSLWVVKSSIDLIVAKGSYIAKESLSEIVWERYRFKATTAALQKVRFMDLETRNRYRNYFLESEPLDFSNLKNVLNRLKRGSTRGLNSRSVHVKDVSNFSVATNRSLSGPIKFDSPVIIKEIEELYNRGEYEAIVSKLKSLGLRFLRSKPINVKVSEKVLVEFLMISLWKTQDYSSALYFATHAFKYSENDFSGLFAILVTIDCYFKNTSLMSKVSSELIQAHVKRALSSPHLLAVGQVLFGENGLNEFLLGVSRDSWIQTGELAYKANYFYLLAKLQLPLPDELKLDADLQLYSAMQRLDRVDVSAIRGRIRKVLRQRGTGRQNIKLAKRAVQQAQSLYSVEILSLFKLLGQNSPLVPEIKEKIDLYRELTTLNFD